MLSEEGSFPSGRTQSRLEIGFKINIQNWHILATFSKKTASFNKKQKENISIT